jgi:hypothetical protein
MRTIGKLDFSEGKRTLVSHVSHRGGQKGCVKPLLFVKSASIAAQDKGLKRPRNPQRTGVPQLPQAQEARWCIWDAGEDSHGSLLALWIPDLVLALKVVRGERAKGFASLLDSRSGGNLGDGD